MPRWLKPVIFLACLAPLADLVWRGLHAQLGANPIEAITHRTGDCTLTFLLITLSVTPLRKLTRQYWLIGLRRMLGLFAFFYGTLHLMTYVWLDKFFNVHEMLVDIAKRRFITAGMTAFVLMIPLALTSSKWAIRKMGGRRWSGSPPLDLFQRRRRSHSLHLAGKSGFEEASGIRVRTCRADALPGFHLDRIPQPATRKSTHLRKLSGAGIPPALKRARPLLGPHVRSLRSPCGDGRPRPSSPWLVQRPTTND